MELIAVLCQTQSKDREEVTWVANDTKDVLLKFWAFRRKTKPNLLVGMRVLQQKLCWPEWPHCNSSWCSFGDQMDLGHHPRAG